jgi:hypothetical protein
MSTPLSRYLLTKLGDIRLSTELPLIEACHMEQIRKLHAPGQIILRRFNCYLDSKLIPGKYSHSGVVEGHGVVIHATAEGVGRQLLDDFCKNADGIWLGICTEPQFSVEKAVTFARQQIGKDYDFDFKVLGNDEKEPQTLFCHKLSALSCIAGGKNFVPELQSLGPVTHEVYNSHQFVDGLAKLGEWP